MTHPPDVKRPPGLGAVADATRQGLPAHPSATHTTEQAVSLTDLAAAISTSHRSAQDACAQAVSHAIRAGELLIQAKAALPHGDFGPWLEANVRFSARTARGYMSLANLDEGKRQRVADMSLRTALRAIAQPVVHGDDPHRDGDVRDGGLHQHEHGHSKYVPQAGHVAVGVYGNDELWVAPSAEHEGFYFVTRLTNDIDGGGCVVEGTARPIRANAVDSTIRLMGFLDFRATWSGYDGAPWPKNVWLGDVPRGW